MPVTFLQRAGRKFWAEIEEENYAPPCCALVLAVVHPSCAGANKHHRSGRYVPYPTYSKWFSEYHNLHDDIHINYQSIGSGGGIRQVMVGTVDFGASDGPMTDEQLSQVPFKLFHIPTVLGSVVPAYNVPGINGEIRFTPEVLAGIYLGKITKWNDPQIVKDNAKLNLPDKPIVVVHRSDGSGTSYIFTDYVSKVSPDWKARVGRNTSVNWPVGLGAKGNEGVAGMVRQMDGGIGYIELIYALQNKIAFGSVRNAAGNFVKGSLESTTAAAASLKEMPADFRISITNPPGKDAYHISSFTWLLIPAHSKDPPKGKILHDFLVWMLDRGQTMTSQLDYAPLPKNVVEKVRATVAEVQ